MGFGEELVADALGHALSPAATAIRPDSARRILRTVIARRAGELVQVEGVAFEMQHLQLLAVLGAGFDGAVQHDQARARRGLGQDALSRRYR